MVAFVVDWCFPLQVTHNDMEFIILNVYTTYECHQNEDDYINRLSVLLFKIILPLVYIH